MPSTMDTDKCNLMGIDLLQVLTMFNRYQPVAGSMDDVRMAVYPAYPAVCSQVIPQKPAMRKKR